VWYHGQAVGEEATMCEDHGHGHVPPVEARPADAAWTGEVLPLEPVDEVSVLTVCDNVMDLLLLDQGPAKRIGFGALFGGAVPRLEAPTLDGGLAFDAPLAQHGFSALVEVRKGDSVRRLLFDTGLTPHGCVENLAGWAVTPATSRSSCAATGTSTTRPGCPGWSSGWAGSTCRW
jgi:hypothetical protein